MKRIHGLILALGLWGIMVPAWAEPALSVPAIPTEVSEVMPPSDMGTPVPLPSDEDLKKSLGQNSKVQESIPAPTATSVPEEPTPTPLKSLVSSPMPFATATEEPGGEGISPLTTPVGGLFDYFPANPGQRAEFTYLKAGKGEAAPRSFTVQCVDFKSNPDGTVMAAFENTQSGSPIRDRYLVSRDEVIHIQSGNQTITGDFLMKMPAPLKTALWEQTHEGFQKIFKATLGPAKVSQNSYPDCLIVEEKDLKDGKKVGALCRYYAKGIGLVSLEIYSADLKLIQSQSFTLTRNASTPEK